MTRAGTSPDGAVRYRPAASTRSLMEKVCASRCHWTWTTMTSLAAKATAHSTHGRFRAVGAVGRCRTTTTNSATATAATATVSSRIRWDGPSRSVRVLIAETLLVVVMALRPVRGGPGDTGPRDAGPRDARPG